MLAKQSNHDTDLIYLLVLAPCSSLSPQALVLVEQQTLFNSSSMWYTQDEC